MSNSQYSITLPYNDFLKLKDKEKELQDLKEQIKDCFEINEKISELCLDKNKIIKIGKSLLPYRYQEYNYAIRG